MFENRLQNAINQYSRLCIGIDAHSAILEEWDLPLNAKGLKDFGKIVIDACVGEISIIKFQISFFESYGAKGYAALEYLYSYIRNITDHSFIIIADAKRGDIASTNLGYANAWLSKDSPLYSDALTISPYLGAGALDIFAKEAYNNASGLFVLAKTSNHEAKAVQEAVLPNNISVSQEVIDSINKWNIQYNTNSFGIVYGATNKSDILNAVPPDMPILAPGFGAQGALLENANEIFLNKTYIPSVSRSVLIGDKSSFKKRILAAKASLGY